MTAPSRHSASVTPNNQRSFSSRLGTLVRLSFWFHFPGFLFTLLDQFFKNASAMLVILKLVEARACRREQHNIATPRSLRGDFHGAFQSAGTLERDAAGDLLFNF